MGNNDEVTDLRFVGPPPAPTHLAVATNSEEAGLCLLFPLPALLSEGRVVDACVTAWCTMMCQPRPCLVACEPKLSC